MFPANKNNTLMVIVVIINQRILTLLPFHKVSNDKGKIHMHGMKISWNKNVVFTIPIDEFLSWILYCLPWWQSFLFRGSIEQWAYIKDKFRSQQRESHSVKRLFPCEEADRRSNGTSCKIAWSISEVNEPPLENLGSGLNRLIVQRVRCLSVVFTYWITESSYSMEFMA